MRRVRYVVAASLDGYIAGPAGEVDWIIMDPAIDFAALFAQFDTVVLGRRTYEGMVASGNSGMPGMNTIVVSRTLHQQDHPEVTVAGQDWEEVLSRLRDASGKDIWLFGGGALFRSMLDARLVDTVEVSIIPVLLGDGVPLLPPPALRQELQLTRHHVYGSGIVSLEYAVPNAR
jgi:dihydrofolate reductase